MVTFRFIKAGLAELIGMALLLSLFLESAAEGLPSPLSSPAQTWYARSWYEGPDVGWSWYKEVPKPRPSSPQRPKITGPSETQENSAPKDDFYPYTQHMEKFRKDLEESLSKAVLFPTLENVREAQKFHNLVMTQATGFQNAWMLASLLSSQNYRESDQASPLHRKIYQEKEEQKLDKDIQNLAKTFGIFFLFKKGCRYCHEMAPIIKKVSEQYHFDIKAISPEGEPIEGFENAAKDNGTIGQINPEGIFPSVFLVNPGTRHVIPLARGLTSPSELKENFKVIIRYLKEEFLKRHGEDNNE